MKIGIGFYGITEGTDPKTGYSRDFRHCWDNIQQNIIQPIIAKEHEVKIYASTYPFKDASTEKEFFKLVNPTKVVMSHFETSDAFTAKSKLHDAFEGEDLDFIIFTRFDIHFHQSIMELDVHDRKINFLFPEGDGWWERAMFTCDCFYAWPHEFSDNIKVAMRETYGWPRGTQYPDTHGMMNMLLKSVSMENIHMMSMEPQISNVNKFYTLCRPNVPEHPCKHPDVRAKYG
jgi:hypothetical protein